MTYPVVVELWARREDIARPSQSLTRLAALAEIHAIAIVGEALERADGDGASISPRWRGAPHTQPQVDANGFVARAIAVT